MRALDQNVKLTKLISYIRCPSYHLISWNKSVMWSSWNSWKKKWFSYKCSDIDNWMAYYIIWIISTQSKIRKIFVFRTTRKCSLKLVRMYFGIFCHQYKGSLNIIQQDWWVDFQFFTISWPWRTIPMMHQTAVINTFFWFPHNRTDIYFLKVNNKWRLSGVFIVNFKQIFTPSSSVSIVNFKACLCYFLSNLFFSLNYSPSKTIKNVLYFI